MESIEEKLDYIGLDLNNVPDFLREFKPIDFRPSKVKEDNKHIVYKYVPIDQIQIFITPKNRLEGIDDKYTKAAPIIAYLEPNNEDNIERHVKFLSMLKKITIEEIENAKEEQKMLSQSLPFDIKYYKSYAWQIYYSESTNQYFMMLPSEDADYDKLFLLLKMQIEFNKSKAKKAPQIFVPINYMDYSEKILKRSQINDIENYIWLFTRDWPNIYEIYDKNDEISLQIIGETEVYDNIKSKYKIKLKQGMLENNHTIQDAPLFYQYIKALFMLQTELPAHYKFKTKVNAKNELEFYYNNTKIRYEKLSEFIENEYHDLQKKYKTQKKQIETQKIELKNLNILAQNRENEYLEKQRQIALYLSCKKTFFGKVKYFFTRKKFSKNNTDNSETKVINSDANVDSNIELNASDVNILSTKPYYTIEDLVTLHYTADKETKELNNINLDIEAIKNKITNLENKVKNATLYIEEIDKHKKSIFEFWKFANKDELKALEVGNTENKDKTKHIRKTFRYEFDFDEFSTQMDALQRIKMSKEEQDSAYIATTSIIDVLNDEELMENSLNELKKQHEENINIYNFQDFDIFGNLQDNRAKTKNLGNQKHRENKKDKFKILSITSTTTIEEYKERINNIKSYLNESFKKIKSKYDISVYAISNEEKPLEKEYAKYYICLEDALKDCNSNESKIKVYKLNIKEEMPLIGCTNIIFYDNYNKTLPEGMNEQKTVILKNNMYFFELISKDDFRTNMYINENDKKVESREITVYEYDVNLK